MRLFILLFLAYVIYRAVSKYFKAPKKRKEAEVMNTAPKVVDELIEDPMCNTYIPKREAYVINIDGEPYFFCSRACAHRFLEAQKSKEGEEDEVLH